MNSWLIKVSAAFMAFILFGYSPIAAEILTVGEFHGDEVHSEDGGLWYGLSFSSEGRDFVVTKAPISIATVVDEIVDEPGAAPTGKKVQFPNGEFSLLLIRDIPGVREGSVDTYFSDQTFLESGTRITLPYSDQKILLAAEGGRHWEESGGPELREPYLISLFMNGKSQRLVEIENCCNDTIPTMIWAGDLDHDSKADLILDISGHFNLSEVALYLSSAAKKGEFVGLVGSFRVTGC